MVTSDSAPAARRRRHLPGDDDGTADMKARRRSTSDPDRPTLLLVEDEEDLQELVRYNLERDGYNVTTVGTGKRALDAVAAQMPDLIILDLMLPGMDGLEVCRVLKSDASTRSIPILMLTAKSEEADVVTGLELGADDYVTKPFSPRVLMARVKAVLRRPTGEHVKSNGDESEELIEHGSLRIRPDRHEATVKDEPIDLTATEFRLLCLLARRPGRVFTRQQIIEAIHGKYSAVTDRSVDVQVVSLRRKLGEYSEAIETVRGVGYRFRD